LGKHYIQSGSLESFWDLVDEYTSASASVLLSSTPTLKNVPWKRWTDAILKRDSFTIDEKLEHRMIFLTFSSPGN
jgi:hypothetical protein